MSTHKLPFPALEKSEKTPLRPAIVPQSAGNASSDVFLRGMLDVSSSSGHGTQSPVKMGVSVLIHAAIIAALVIVPLYLAKNVITLQKLTPTYVFTPPLPAAPPPPPAAATRAPKQVQVTPKFVQPTLVTPRETPKQAPVAESSAPAPDLNAGVVGGVPGGVPGGVLGGVLGGTGTAPAPPPAPAIVRVGGNVKAPQLIKQVQPQYPAVARVAHVQGTVVIDAVIDKTGNVVSEHAVSGPGILVPAALNAVHDWKYQPTYLNGQPVDLAMQVTVDFKLG